MIRSTICEDRFVEVQLQSTLRLRNTRWVGKMNVGRLDLKREVFCRLSGAGSESVRGGGESVLGGDESACGDGESEKLHVFLRFFGWDLSLCFFVLSGPARCLPTFFLILFFCGSVEFGDWWCFFFGLEIRFDEAPSSTVSTNLQIIDRFEYFQS